MDLHPSALVDDVKGKNGDKTRNTVIAIGTVLLVVIAYLTLKHLQSGSTATDAATPTSGNAGDVGTEGEAEDTDINGITSQLGAENGVLVAGFANLTKQLNTESKQLTNVNKRLVNVNKKLATADKRLAKIAPKATKKAAKKVAPKPKKKVNAHGGLHPVPKSLHGPTVTTNKPTHQGVLQGLPKHLPKPVPHKPVVHPKHPAKAGG